MPPKGLISSPRQGHPPAALTHLAVAGYRSLQQASLPLGGLTLVSRVNPLGRLASIKLAGDGC